MLRIAERNSAFCLAFSRIRFSLWSGGGRAAQRLARQGDVFMHGHFFGAALHVERAGKAALLEPAAQGVAQQLAALAEGHLHQLGKTGQRHISGRGQGLHAHDG